MKPSQSPYLCINYNRATGNCQLGLWRKISLRKKNTWGKVCFWRGNLETVTLSGIWNLVPITGNSKDRSMLQPREINFFTGSVLAVFNYFCFKCFHFITLKICTSFLYFSGWSCDYLDWQLECYLECFFQGGEKPQTSQYFGKLKV